MKTIEQYSGALNLAQIAAGMNHCQDNAKRLLRSAKALYKIKDYATAVSLAVLAIEEAGKTSILRGMVMAVDDAEMRKGWKEFRSHCQKNGFADLMTCMRSTLRLDDCRSVVTKGEKNYKTDDLKQIGFYVDCVGDAVWLIPEETITEEIAVKVLTVAGIVCRSKTTTTVRELELWKETVGACPQGTLQEQKQQLVLWRRRMEAEGLVKPDPGFEKFVMGGVAIPDMTGHPIPECALSIMRSELSVNGMWKDVEMKERRGGVGEQGERSYV